MKKLSFEMKQKQSAQICDQIKSNSIVRNAQKIGAFMPTQNEPQITPVIEWLLRMSKRVYVPKMTDKNRMIMTEVDNIDTLSHLEHNEFGIEELTSFTRVFEVVGSRSLFAIDNRFSQSLNRLGHGKGCYDRWIARVKRWNIRWIIGIGFSVQLVEDIPTEKHDFGVNELIIGSES
ncbi:hypothetical protein ACOME3_001625 [Neoechinorhynchus agilis]